MNASPRKVLAVQDLEISIVQPERVLFRGLNIEVDRGELIGLAGFSGSGKSTLALAILGLLPDAIRVTTGSIYFLGQNLFGSWREGPEENKGAKNRNDFSGTFCRHEPFDAS